MFDFLEKVMARVLMIMTVIKLQINKTSMESILNFI